MFDPKTLMQYGANKLVQLLERGVKAILCSNQFTNYVVQKLVKSTFVPRVEKKETVLFKMISEIL